MEGLFSQILNWLYTEAGIVGVILATIVGALWWDRRRYQKHVNAEIERLRKASREGWEAYNALVKETNAANVETVGAMKDMTNALNLLTAKLGQR